MPNYKNSKIYKILNVVDDEVFVGSTVQKLSCSMGNHRARYITGDKRMNRKLYKHMRDTGIKNFHIYLVEEYPCDSKKELYEREAYWIKELGGTLNTERPREFNKKEWTREYGKKKIICEICGSETTPNHLRRHQKTKKCQSFI
jgi:hypothetical protein